MTDGLNHREFVGAAMAAGSVLACGSQAIGTVVDAKTVAHCQSLIADALEKGPELLIGGETTSNVLMPAHVVDGLTPDMKLFRGESFGPVVGIIRARDARPASTASQNCVG